MALVATSSGVVVRWLTMGEGSGWLTVRGWGWLAMGRVVQ